MSYVESCHVAGLHARIAGLSRSTPAQKFPCNEEAWVFRNKDIDMSTHPDLHSLRPWHLMTPLCVGKLQASHTGTLSQLPGQHWQTAINSVVTFLPPPAKEDQDNTPRSGSRSPTPLPLLLKVTLTPINKSYLLGKRVVKTLPRQRTKLSH